MRGISKKIFISILTSVIVMVTMVATTFAWVGIFTYASTDNFQINLKVSELDSNYYLTISSTGEKKSFSDSISSIEIERQIVNNRYDNNYIDKSDTIIENVFSKIKLSPVSTKIINNTFSDFEEIDFNYSNLKLDPSNDYYKFDIYVSVGTKEGITSETTGINSNILLTNLEEMLTGTLSTGKFLNSNPFGDLPSSQVNDILKSIPDTYTVNSKNACRIGLSFYEPIEVDKDYTGLETPVKSLIYQGGNELPSYDNNTDSYDLGGCLPEDQNTALQELKVIRPAYSKLPVGLYQSKLTEAMNRNDLTISEENSKIWDKQDNYKYLGVMNGIQTKIKITVFFWFEGWDSDCLQLIENNPVSLMLTFTSGIEE